MIRAIIAQLEQQAAERAVEFVELGMVVGQGIRHLEGGEHDDCD